MREDKSNLEPPDAAAGRHADARRGKRGSRVVQVLSALLMAATALVSGPGVQPAAAGGAGAEIGMPFAGYWDRFNIAGPSYHGPSGNSYADWAVDIYAAAGTSVRPRVSGPNLQLRVAGVFATCGTAGQTVSIDVITNGEVVGNIRYGHLANVSVSSGQTIQPTTVIGKLSAWPRQTGCWEVNTASGIHTHFTSYNVSDYSCYYNVPSGGAVSAEGRGVGIVGGNYASAVRAQCSQTLPDPVSRPGAPGRPACTVNDNGTLRFSWSAAATNGGSILEYRLEYRNRASGNTNTIGVGTSRNRTVTPAQLGTAYDARAQARNSAGWGTWSSFSPTCVARKAPGVPASAPACASTAAGQLTFSWGAAATNGDAIDEYQIEYRPVGGSTTAASAGTARTLAVSSLAPNQAYEARVRARNASGWGNWTAYGSPCSTVAAPGAPGGLDVNSSGSSATVTWDAPTSASPVTEYKVEVENVTDSTSTVESAGTSRSLEVALAAGKTYRFRVQAISAAGDGPFSGWSDSVSGADTTAPNLSVTTPAVNSTVETVSVTGTVTDGTGVARVQVGLYSSTEGWYRAPGQTSNFLDADLAEVGASSTTYDHDFAGVPDGLWQVYARSYDTSGNRTLWTRVRFRVGTLDDTAPSVTVTTPAVNATIETAAVSGTATDATGVARVQVGLYSSSEGWYRAPGQASNFVDATLAEAGGTDTTFGHEFAGTPDGSWQFYVRAYDVRGNRTSWQRIRVTIGAQDDDAPVLSVSVPEPGDTVEEVTVSGSATDATGVARVQVGLYSSSEGWYRAPGQASIWVDATLSDAGGTSVTFDQDFAGAPDGTWRVYARAYDVRNNRSLWTRVLITVDQGVEAPGVPQTVRASSGENGRSNITWVAPTSNGGSAITSYEVKRSDITTPRTASGTSYSWTGLSNDTTYRFQVRACNEAGCGAYSSLVSATPDVRPGRVGRPSVSSLPNQLRVTWSAPSNSGSPITRYEIRGSRTGSTSGARTFTFNMGQDGGSKTFQVRACNDLACGDWSTSSTGLRAKTISVSRGAAAPAGYWYNTTVTGPPGWSVTLQCNDGVDTNFYSQSATTSSAGTYTDTTLCYSGDANPHWVTGGGVSSNRVNF